MKQYTTYDGGLVKDAPIPVPSMAGTRLAIQCCIRLPGVRVRQLSRAFPQLNKMPSPASAPGEGIFLIRGKCRLTYRMIIGRKYCPAGLTVMVTSAVSVDISCTITFEVSKYSNVSTPKKPASGT